MCGTAVSCFTSYLLLICEHSERLLMMTVGRENNKLMTVMTKTEVNTRLKPVGESDGHFVDTNDSCQSKSATAN